MIWDRSTCSSEVVVEVMMMRNETPCKCNLNFVLEAINYIKSTYKINNILLAFASNTDPI